MGFDLSPWIIVRHYYTLNNQQPHGITLVGLFLQHELNKTTADLLPSLTETHDESAVLIPPPPALTAAHSQTHGIAIRNVEMFKADQRRSYTAPLTAADSKTERLIESKQSFEPKRILPAPSTTLSSL